MGIWCEREDVGYIYQTPVKLPVLGRTTGGAFANNISRNNRKKQTKDPPDITAQSF